MRYYACIKDFFEEHDNRDDNLFIQYAFGKKNTEVQFKKFTKKFECGKVYHTPIHSDKYLLDDNGILHNIEDITSHFKEIKIELDEYTKSVITNKTTKGDKIEIEPRLVKNLDCMSLLYLIRCSLRSGRTCISNSQSPLDGIIACYSELRKDTYNYWVLKKSFDVK